VVQTVQHGDGHDLGAAGRGGRRTDGHELTDPLMRPGLVEVPEAVFVEDALEVTLAEHDRVVQPFATDISEKALSSRPERLAVEPPGPLTRSGLGDFHHPAPVPATSVIRHEIVRDFALGSRFHSAPSVTVPKSGDSGTLDCRRARQSGERRPGPRRFRGG
jgi:hypothetical protein